MEIEDGVAVFPNGLRLRLTPGQVSKGAIYDATRRHPDPDPPKVWIESAARFEENADDPDYRRNLELAKERRSWAAVKAMIILGTELEAAPDGLIGPEEVDWERFAAVRDMPSPTNKFDRYELWLRYHALSYNVRAEDLLPEFAALTTHLAIMAGVTMEGAAAITASFRDQAGRGAAEPGDDLATNGNGDGDRHAAANPAKP